MPETLVGQEIAVVGIGCRFPGAAGPAEFWRLLRTGTEAVTVFSAAELAEAGVPRELVDDPHYVPAAGVVADSDMFDARLFGINPREATLMDPQHRIMLECAWEALEDGGRDPRDLKERVGVFAGSYKNDYRRLLGPLTEPSEQFLAGVSNDADYLATRISFKLDLTGPSVSVQTACSTALVAVHLACESLLAGSCDLALAGGVTIRSGEAPGYLFHRGGIYSPDGHCRAFDAGAEGTVIGEGAGLVVLKRLADALADGDRIRAVIKGSAAGNDGADRVGFSAPGVAGQSRIVRAALERSGVDPDTIGYVETHGSGTPLGDRIEIDALTRAFRAAGWSGGTRAIGSVKTNIGHTHAAAGIAGLIKTILTLENREIPPSLHFAEPNPRIDFAASPFHVATGLTPWHTDGAPRRAGVSSFGMGGTGVHLVLEEAPPAPPVAEPEGQGARPDSARAWHVLPLSAADPQALEAATDRLADHLAAHPGAEMAAVARTLQTGRHAFDHRRVLAVRDRDDAVETLRARTPQRVHTLGSAATARRVAFLLPGLGEQYENMGLELYEADPVFHDRLDHCLEILRERAGLDLRPVLFTPERRDRATERTGLRAMLGRSGPEPGPSALDETRHAQPAMFALEYALAQVWLSRGVRPDALIGYSLGEYVAATLAGVFSLEDALSLVAERARMIDGLPGGAMLAVQLPEKDVIGLLDGETSLAAVNGPDLSVIAGPDRSIAALRERLAAEGVAARPLRTTHAFHSTMMEPICAAFTELVGSVARNRPELPYLSNVTGDWITDADATDPAYYARHLREAVRFSDGVRRLWEQPGRLLLEVGVGQSLGSMAQQARPRTADAGSLVLGTLPGAAERDSDAAAIAATTGKLWLCGVDVDWDGVQPGRRRAPLPTYPFQRRRFWPAGGLAVAAAGEGGRAADGASAGGRQELADWFHVPRWESLPPASPGRRDAGAGDGAGPERWLLFADELGVAERLGRELAGRGDEVITVRRGAGFAATDERSYRIDPGNDDDYVELLRRVRADGGPPTRIAHLWLVTERPDDPTDPAVVDEVTRDGFTGLLALARAIGRETLADGVDVAVVSSEMHAIADGDVSQPAKALALGPCRVWPLENPALTCRSIDIGRPAPAIAARLLTELDRPVTADTGAEVVAIRGRLHLRQEFHPVRLDHPAEPRHFRAGGTYLITGGLGGVGLSLAEYLAGHVRANLVLVGRAALPPRQEWDRWADRPEGDVVADRIRAVRRLEEAGGTVMVAAADVTDADQLGGVVRQAVERFGALHGVVHAAGVPGGGLIQLKEAGAAEAVLAPKVRGALALRRACASLPLDFVMHCSSGIAVSGGVGQVDYTAANAFLDALAHHDDEADGPAVVSINWDAWQGVGMAARTIGGAADGERPREAPVRHPFLERRLTSADGDCFGYVAHFDARESWLVDEHRMLGRPVVPGVGHLELVRAAFAETRLTREQGSVDPGDQGVELSEVTFYTPIVIPEDGRRQVRVVLERDGGGPEGDDGMRFAVVSAHRDASTGGDERWQLHSTGRVARLTGARPRRLDIETLIDGSGLRDVGRPANDGPMGFGARSQCLQRMYVGDGEFLALLELPEPFRDEVAELPLHPALMDIATAFVGVHHAAEFRIPISYGRIRMFAPLTSAVYSHQSYRDGGDRAGKETVTSDVTITDLAGRELLHAERFVLKRVHDLEERLTVAQAATPGRVELYDLPPALDDGRTDGQAGGGTGGRGEPSADFLRTALDHGMSPGEGAEVFGRIVAAGLTPQVLVSTRDLASVFDQVAPARTATADATAAGEDAGTGAGGASLHPRPDLLTPYEAPRDAVEERLAAVWQDLLGVEKVGVHDAFTDLGGHSLLGLQLVPRLREAFAVDLPIGTIFDARTLADLADAVRAAGGATEAA
ncbi:SDR family NAD(P)-dependent oxidoreductase [Sphaerimonospora mesophila]|uniref:type I polyketide synthase n=1 Tax=Sphaerimonospora mesophila TaxID=37483 RepID=UPI0006E2BCBB